MDAGRIALLRDKKPAESEHVHSHEVAKRDSLWRLGTAGRSAL